MKGHRIHFRGRVESRTGLWRSKRRISVEHPESNPAVYHMQYNDPVKKVHM